jgi:hypothetical protein
MRISATASLSDPVQACAHTPGSSARAPPVGLRLAIVANMASPASSPAARPPAVPAADPVAIRACLTSAVAAEFDAEWEHVLEAAKRSKDLTGVHELLAKWRQFAYGELLEPGRYFRVLAAAAQAQAAGRPVAGAASADDVRALIQQRLNLAEPAS